jgi:hypothetical protein
MPIPLHTFAPFDGPCVLFEKWFEDNPHVLFHTKEEIIRDAEKYEWDLGPSEPGIYFLIQGDAIAYVGRALTIRDRLKAHHEKGRQFDRYWCFGGMPDDWQSHLEGFYIKRMKPFMNIATVSYDPFLNDVSKRYIP